MDSRPQLLTVGSLRKCPGLSQSRCPIRCSLSFLPFFPCFFSFPQTLPQRKRPKKLPNINVTSYSYSYSPVAIPEIICPLFLGYCLIHLINYYVMRCVITHTHFFIEVELIYNAVLVPGLEQSDSVMHLYAYTFSHSFPLWFITRY